MDEMFSTKTMLGVIEASKSSNAAWLRDRYFSDVKTFDTTKIEFDIRGLDDRKILPFVNPLVGGQQVTRGGYTTEVYEAPELSPFMVTSAEDLLARRPGENAYSGRSPEERAGEQLGEDLRDLDAKITRTEEIMCADALFQGKIDVKGKGYDDVISYWSHLESQLQPKTTIGSKWDSVDAKAIAADLRVARQTMMRQGGFTPRDLVCGTKVINAILDKLQDGKMLDLRRVDMGLIDPQHLPDGVTYWGYLKDSGLDIYSYDNWYTNAKGQAVSMVPENLALLASPGAKTSMAYGCCALASPEDGLKFFSERRVPESYVSRRDPAGRIVQIKSRPLPLIQQIYGFRVLEAIAA